MGILVDSKPIVTEDLVYQIQSQGTVKPKLETNLSSEVNGRIVEVAEQFIEGGFFNQGDLLVRVEQADYQTNVKAAQASLANTEAALEEEKARGRVAEEEWRSFTDGNAPELGLRRPQLASALALVRSAEAELERAKRDLARTEIRAPYAGLVKSRSANLGQFISRGSVLGVIYGTDVAEVRLPLTDNDLAFIKLPTMADETMQPKVEFNATVAGKPMSWQGKIVRTEGILDQRSRVIYAVAQITDPYQRQAKHSGEVLRFGRFVQANILGSATADIIVIPRHLLLTKQQVLVIDNQQQLQFRQVVVERTDERFAYIRQGFAADDVLATSAIANPLAGTVVRLAVAKRAAEQPAKPAVDNTAQLVKD
ncbi:efflux RND transporter periplasmic adaptor subunit [Rheinheimera salexigens]|uniref:efflux RND transporter periplasmic adaptor subunit n=1 Tax=Rheinheimera salexigens TaxID=1628148 RepID=UPI001F419481|nr:efflux RND transporter periplasmic adaptor subunit [Rheinheimera salexigens]